MKKILIAIVLFLGLSTLSFAQTDITTTQDTKLVLYVREGCVHCAKVKAFLTKYNLEDQVKIVETYNQPDNQKELESWFTKLNVTDPNQMGVPFLVINDSEYFVGDVPIIDYLAKKNNITVEAETYSTSTADMIFLGIGGLFLFGVLGYGVYTKIGKKK